MYDTLKPWLTAELDKIREAGLYKNERVIISPQGAEVTLEGGRKVLVFCANNYLGLSSHPKVIAAAHAASVFAVTSGTTLRHCSAGISITCPAGITASVCSLAGWPVSKCMGPLRQISIIYWSDWVQSRSITTSRILSKCFAWRNRMGWISSSTGWAAITASAACA